MTGIKGKPKEKVGSRDYDKRESVRSFDGLVTFKIIADLLDLNPFRYGKGKFLCEGQMSVFPERELSDTLFLYIA